MAMASTSQAVLSDSVRELGFDTVAWVADSWQNRFRHHEQSNTAHRQPLEDPVHQAP